jgi:hypothetical protein
MIHRTDPTLLAGLRFILATIRGCFVPLGDDIYYWKSYRDADNVWRKKKMELSDKEIQNIIQERRDFLAKHPAIELLEEEVFHGVMITRKKLLERYDEFLRDGCQGDLLIEISIDDF